MPPFPVRRWTLAEYRHLAEIGVLTEDDRVELLEGWIVPKMTKNPPHEWTVTRINRTLDRATNDDWLVRTQCAINTFDSEPEPDGAVVRGPEERFADRHPHGNEIGLIIEVADSTLAKDRRKAAIYAAEGVPCYWLVNLVDRQIEVHTDPDCESHQYRKIMHLSAGDSVDFVLDETTLASYSVDSFLPPKD